ncbi:hypothetical protein [Kineococcus sp. SYSU DK004]|uniref:hypothetical protein n=1 Tax=Kineococcus sp. SYSU DK004 TaxID=3383125 RepID=UPI003D7EDA2F
MPTTSWPSPTPPSRRRERGHPAAGTRWRGGIAALELLTAAWAVVGGVAMLRDPLTPLGASTDLIAGSPFDTFTWPGALLLGLVGIAPALLAAGLLLRVRGAVLLSAFFGVGMVAWIAVQWVLLADRLWLQPLVLGVGVLITVSALLAFRRGVR